MITRTQADASRLKLEEIKNRLIQIGLFMEMDDIFDNLSSINDSMSSFVRSYNYNRTNSGSSSGSSDSGEDLDYEGVTFSETHDKILKSLKNNISILMNEIESEINNHLE